MSSLRIGDIVTRKSYGGDIYFKIADITSRTNGKKIYLLKGIIYRIIADSEENDLEWRDPDAVRQELKNRLSAEGMHHMSRDYSAFRDLPAFKLFKKIRGKSGTILHLDSSKEFLEMCQSYYSDAKIKSYCHIIPESEQPGSVRALLASTKADILIATGHDGLKKNAGNKDSLDSYRNSKYFMQTAQIARKFEPSFDKLCIFSGACQSYYEKIMEAGANFASSPGRILIHALDPAKVGDRIALTNSRLYVTPEQIAKITQSGIKGIGGLKTKGHYVLQN